jgi:phosphatidylglycerophosphate synthase
LAIPLIARDALMLGVGFTDPSLKEGWLPPNRVGKAHAALAFSTLTLAIAQAAGLFDLGRFMTWLYALLFVTVLLSAALYFVAWRRGHREVGSDVSTV